MSGYCPSTGSMGSNSLTLTSPVYINHSDTPYEDHNDHMVYNDEYKPIYSRIRVIGEGTYGTVYLAKNLSTSKLCVIKQMKRFENDEGGIQPTQLREASLLKNLNHKYIVQMQDIFLTHHKEFCLVFEHCQMDLAQYMDQNSNKGINLELIRKWSYQMICGVSYMHSRRILHRDLKPQNILLTHDMDIKIADLGLGKECTLPLKPPMTTNIVTLWYRPPELLLGAKCYSSKLDIWSLGCIIAEMSRNGKVLFGGLCEWEVLIAILQFFGTPANNEAWCRGLPYFYNALPKFKGWKFEDRIGCLRDDKDSVDLLKNMLNMDSTKRMNAIQLMNHAWFETIADELCNESMEETKNKANETCIVNNRKWEQYFDDIKEVDSPSTPRKYDNHGSVQPEMLQFASRTNSCEIDSENETQNNKSVFGSFGFGDVKVKSNFNKTNDIETQSNSNKSNEYADRNMIDSSPVF
eukprot:212345_1